jgi:hypothetical protein
MSLHFKIPPQRYRGRDAEGHFVFVVATLDEIRTPGLAVLCLKCGAYVTAVWDIPKPAPPTMKSGVTFKGTWVPNKPDGKT